MHSKTQGWVYGKRHPVFVIRIATKKAEYTANKNGNLYNFREVYLPALRSASQCLLAQ